MEREALKLAFEKIERFITKRGYFDDFADEITAIKEALAQPAQEPIGFAGVKIWVGNQQVVKLLTRIELDHAIDPWLHVKLNADMCIATLLKRMSK
jgi:hypothetical protein